MYPKKIPSPFILPYSKVKVNRIHVFCELSPPPAPSPGRGEVILPAKKWGESQKNRKSPKRGKKNTKEG